MIDGIIAGRLVGTPAQRIAKNGSPFAVAKVRVATREADAAVFVSVICFSESGVRTLLALADGDSVALAGELTPKVWVDKAGEARPQLDMLCHAVLTPYHVKRKREAMHGKRDAPRDADGDRGHDGGDGAAEGEQPAQMDRDFNDEIPF